MKNKLKDITTIFFDFDGVFTDNAVYVDQNGNETVRCNRSDGLGISMLRDAGINMAIISTEENPVVTARASKLKIPVFQGCKDKAAFLKNYMEKENIDPEYTGYVGNDVNDLDAMSLVNFKICPGDAYPEIKKIANIKLKSKGGGGAVREFCDLIINTRRK